MIDPQHELPLIKQAALLDLSRTSIYYQAQTTSAADLMLMRRIDELHMEQTVLSLRRKATVGDSAIKIARRRRS